jgi:hypothetical protein
MDQIYNQFRELEKFEKIYDDYQLHLLNHKKTNNTNFKNLFDFSGITTIDELNFKIGEDVKMLKFLPEYFKFELIQYVQLIINDFNDSRHEEFHFNIFDLLSDIYREKFLDRDLDLSAFGKCLNREERGLEV